MTTDLGTDWNEVDGDWGKQSGELVENYASGSTGSSDAILICTQAVPVDSAGDMFCSIDIVAASVVVGDVYKLYPCCTDDDTIGPVVATFVCTADGEWTVSISGGGGAGDSRTVYIVGSPTYITAHVCADNSNGHVRAWLSPANNEQGAWDETDPGIGRYAGLGHNNAGHLNRFDNWVMGELRTSTVVCADCFCQCDLTVVPKILTATFVAGDGRGACFTSADTFELEPFWGPETTTWRGDFSKSGDDAHFELICGTGDAATFSLQFIEPWGECCGPEANCDELYMANEDSTCSPLVLRFGPFALSFTWGCHWCYNPMEPVDCIGPTPPDECEGTYFIEITE